MRDSIYEAVIGLEIHAQLNTQSKIFCADPTNFDAGDNENTSAVSVGMPGTLPTLNLKVVELAVRTGLALGCEIRGRSVFARKNYFYPDLPKGYQISQYDEPICENGNLEFLVGGQTKAVRITRAHLEEDAGKSTHFGEYTLINYNRAGIPLLEIVSAPDLRTPAEAAEYAKMLRQILRYLDVCDGNLEEGSLRCDCNISVRRRGETRLGTKVEIKNVNSFRFVEKALEFEIDRQTDCLERGEKIIQETRLWDSDKNRTFSMRTKEDAEDYRYFPDPDLLPIVVSESVVAALRNQIPELPMARQRRLQQKYGLAAHDSQILTEEKALADFFEAATQVPGASPRTVSGWVLNEILRELNLSQKSILDAPVSAEHLGQLVSLIESGKISGKIAKSVFSEMWTTQKAPDDIIKEKGLIQISDTSLISKIVDDVLAAHPSQVADYRSGKVKIIGFLVGAVMKASKGQANPDLVNEILTQKLKGNA